MKKLYWIIGICVALLTGVIAYKFMKGEKPTDVTTEKAANPDEIDLTTPENKWANIRDVCDSYDLQMQVHMNNIKSKMNI